MDERRTFAPRAAMSAPTVAISGCGAVTELYHGPALAQLSAGGRVRVIGVADPAAGRRDAIGRCFPEARRTAEFAELLALGPDLVVVASPPNVHHEQVLAALAAGAHVLCEKPLATRGVHAREMATKALAHDRVLAVGMIRRYLPAARLVRQIVADEIVGAIQRFDVFEGGPFRWPFHAADYFRLQSAGGGVLADIGPHVVDLLSWWLGPVASAVAADDALGGVDANALLEIRCGSATGRIRLSRDWFRPNRVVLEGSGGRIVWDLEDVDRIVLERAGIRESRAAGSPAATFESCFELQLRDLLDAMAGRPSTVVRADEAVQVVEVVERAYRDSALLEMPWLGPRERSHARRIRAQ